MERKNQPVIHTYIHTSPTFINWELTSVIAMKSTCTLRGKNRWLRKLMIMAEGMWKFPYRPLKHTRQKIIFSQLCLQISFLWFHQHLKMISLYASLQFCKRFCSTTGQLTRALPVQLHDAAICGVEK